MAVTISVVMRQTSLLRIVLVSQLVQVNLRSLVSVAVMARANQQVISLQVTSLHHLEAVLSLHLRNSSSLVDQKVDKVAL